MYVEETVLKCTCLNSGLPRTNPASSPDNLGILEARLLFIVLFAKNCTNQIKSNYLNSHGEEAQEKPLGL